MTGPTRHLRFPLLLTAGLVVVAVLVYGVQYGLSRRAPHADEYDTARLRMNDASVFVQIPLTEQESTRGLGERDGLDPDHGMLWKYAKPQQVTFWMKGMRFPLDFIWIRQNEVIGVTPNVPAPSSLTDLPLYRPPAPVDRVLEVNAGYAATHDITVGTKVSEFAF